MPLSAIDAKRLRLMAMISRARREKEAAAPVPTELYVLLVAFVYALALSSFARDVLLQPFPPPQYARDGTAEPGWDQARRDSFLVGRFLFLRGLGLSAAAAGASLWGQCEGLIGSRGILPVGTFLEHKRPEVAQLAEHGIPFWLAVPTVCWAAHSDRVLHMLCATVTFCGMLLAMPPTWLPFPVPSAALCCIAAVSYASLKAVAQDFLSLQWDALLIEVLCIGGVLELEPLLSGAWLAAAADLGHRTSLSSRVGLFLAWWLALRLEWSSGVVKLSSGCCRWRAGDAMRYHYWTQPLPVPAAVLVHRLRWPGLVALQTWGAILVQLTAPLLLLVPPLCPIRTPEPCCKSPNTHHTTLGASSQSRCPGSTHGPATGNSPHRELRLLQLPQCRPHVCRN